MASCEHCHSYQERKVDGRLEDMLLASHVLLRIKNLIAKIKEVIQMHSQGKIALRCKLAEGGPIRAIEISQDATLNELLKKALQAFFPQQSSFPPYRLAFNTKLATNLSQTVRDAGLKPEEEVLLMPQQVTSGAN